MNLVRSHVQQNQILAAKFDRWMEIQDYSVNSRRTYNTLTSDFCRFLGPQSLSEVKTIHIRQYFEFQQKRGLHDRSLALKLQGLRAFFGFLTLGNVMRTNVAHLIKTRRQHRRLPRFPTIEEVSRIIKAAGSLRDRAIIETLYGTGCRVAEVAAIRCEDIDFKTNVVTVHGKGNVERIGLFGRMAKKAVLAYLA